MTKSEILFYYESRQNPNGDPDAENQPRLMHDDTIMVTDVRIKRTIRDYAKEKNGYTLFVDYNDDGKPTKPLDRAKEIAKNANIKTKDPDYRKILLEHTFDVPLFGCLVPDSTSHKLTGPVQFAIGRSINKVNIVQPTITSRFVGRKKKNDEGDEEQDQHSTIGRFSFVEYALIKIMGAINPNNLDDYLDGTIKDNFCKYRDELPSLLWNGTNELVTRSKYPQRSILFIQIDYKDTIYNDLADLVNEDDKLKERGQIPKLGPKSFNFDNLIQAMKDRKDEVEKIKIKCIETKFVSSLKSELDKIGINVEFLL